MEKDNLLKYWQSGIITDSLVLDSFRAIDRTLFVPVELKEDAYDDWPLPIGFGQTISQPTTVMIMTQALEPKSGMKILEIGCGSGYQAALLACIVGSKGKIYSVERIADLINLATKNLHKANIKNVELIEGDGTLGLANKSPFDRIIVTAASPAIPQTLIDQLKEEGIIVIPVGQYSQTMTVGKKRKGKMGYNSLGEFTFVPLLGKFGFKEKM